MADAPIDIPHQFQETDYTCGPAALKMVHDAILEVPMPEADMAAAMDTESKDGTRQRVMAQFAEKLGFETYVRHTDTDVQEIAKAMEGGHAVIVCYWLAHEDTDHYAVVSALGHGMISLHDPWVGPDYVLSIEDFDAQWFGDGTVPGRRDRWMLAIKVPA